MLFQFPNSITSDNEMNADSQLEPFLTVLIISEREKKISERTQCSRDEIARATNLP